MSDSNKKHNLHYQGGGGHRGKGKVVEGMGEESEGDEGKVVQIDTGIIRKYQFWTSSGLNCLHEQLDL